MDGILFQGHGFLVTDTLARTPKKSFSIDRIEGVSLRRSFFLMAIAPAIGSMALAIIWWRYLYVGEITFLLLGGIVALIASYHFGTLKVSVLSARDEDDSLVYGRFGHLDQVRGAIETALQKRDARGRGFDHD